MLVFKHEHFRLLTKSTRWQAVPKSEVRGVLKARVRSV